MRIARKILADQTGATGIEYGLIASLIAMAAMSGFNELGNVWTAVMVTPQSDTKISFAEATTASAFTPGLVYTPN